MVSAFKFYFIIYQGLNSSHFIGNLCQLLGTKKDLFDFYFQADLSASDIEGMLT